MGKQILVSCFQCASLHHCYSEVQALQRKQARKTAQECTSWYRGLNNEVIKVLGRRRGMSRKNAQRLCSQGQACYVRPGLLIVFSYSRGRAASEEG